MSDHIKNMVESCHACVSHRSANPREPMISHELPTLPWQKVGVDFFDLEKKKYVVVIDFYSNYIELATVSSTSATVLIPILKSIFSRHGIPVELISDNGPPFTSVEFKSFMFEWGLEHSTSSPHFPRSNGVAESGVKIAKRILSKCKESGSDVYQALLQYRTTPKGNLASPSQLLMSRSLRTQLPMTMEKLKPAVVKVEDHILSKQENIAKSKLYFDKGTKSLSDLKEGDKVWYKKTEISPWSPGLVKFKCPEPRSFVVETPDGSCVRRNRQHLLKDPYSGFQSSSQSSSSSQDNSSSPSSFSSHEISPSSSSACNADENGPICTRSGRPIMRPSRYIEEC